VINGYHFGSHRNADPLYDIPKRIVRHELMDSPLRVSAMRSLGAYANIFGIESFMDELAHQAGVDPLDFRLRHLRDERAKAVLQATADRAGWGSRAVDAGHGWGIAFARYKNKQTYCAVAVEVAVDTMTGHIQLKQAVIGADSGQVINPDGLSNQLEGGFVQAASWTMFEQVEWDANGVRSHDWETYPILSFPDAPVIQVVLLNRPQLPTMGAGEASQNPTPAAIANAVYAAVGARLRTIPFTPQVVLNALSDVGK
jgi:CO/xanthine dehydrogenase Mo-binding subunit